MRELDAYDFLVCSLPQRLSQVSTGMLDELIREHKIARSKDNSYLRSRQDKCTALALHGSQKYQEVFRTTRLWRDLEKAAKGPEGVQAVVKTWGLKSFQSQLGGVQKSLALRKQRLEERLTEIEERVRTRENLERAMLDRANALLLEGTKDRERALAGIEAQVGQLRQNEINLWKYWKELVRKRVILERLTEALVWLTQSMLEQLDQVGVQAAVASPEAKALEKTEKQLASMEEALTDRWAAFTTQNRAIAEKTAEELESLRKTVADVRGELARAVSPSRDAQVPAMLQSVQQVADTVESIDVDPATYVQEEWVKYGTTNEDVTGSWVSAEVPLSAPVSPVTPVPEAESAPAVVPEAESAPAVASEAEVAPAVVSEAEPAPVAAPEAEPVPAAVPEAEPAPAVVSEAEPAPTIVFETEPEPVVAEAEPAPKGRKGPIPAALVASAEHASVEVRAAQDDVRKDVEDQRALLRDQWKALQQLWTHLESLEDTAELPETITADMLQAKTEEVLSRAMKIQSVLEQTEETLTATQQMLHSSVERYNALQHQLSDVLRSLLEPNVLASYPQSEDLDPVQALEDLTIYLSKQKQWKGQFERLQAQYAEMRAVHKQVMDQVTVWLQEEADIMKSSQVMDDAWMRTQEALQHLNEMISFYQKRAIDDTTAPRSPAVLDASLHVPSSTPAPETSDVAAPETPAPETSDVAVPETPASETSDVAAPETPAMETPEVAVPETPVMETSEVAAPEMPTPETLAVVAPETPAPETPEVVAPETPATETSEVAAPEMPAPETPDVAAPEMPAPETPVQEMPVGDVESHVMEESDTLRTEPWKEIPLAGEENDYSQIVKKIRKTRNNLVQYARHKNVYREFPKDAPEVTCPEGGRAHVAPGRGPFCVPDTSTTTQLEEEIQRLVMKIPPRGQDGGKKRSPKNSDTEGEEEAPATQPDTDTEAKKEAPATQPDTDTEAKKEAPTEAAPSVDDAETMLQEDEDFREKARLLGERMKEETERLRTLRKAREKEVVQQAEAMRSQILTMHENVEKMGSMYHTQVAELKNKLIDLHAKENAAQAMLRTSQEKLKELQTQLAQAVQRGQKVEGLEKQIAEYIATVESIRGRLDKALVDVATYRTQWEATRLDNSDIQRLEDTQAKARTLLETLDQEEAAGTWSDLRKAHYTEWRPTLQRELERIEGLLTDKMGTTREVTELIEHIHYLEEQLREEPQEDAQVAEWKARVAAAEARWQEARAEARREMEGVIEQLRQELEKKTARMLELENDWKTAEQTRDNLMTSYKTLEETQGVDRSTIGKLQAELEQMRTTAADLSALLKWTGATNATEIKSRWDQLQSAHASMETQLRVKTEHVKKLEEILARAREGQEVAAMTEALQKEEEEKRKLMDQITDGQMKLKELTFQTDAQSQELKDLLERLKLEQQRYNETEDMFHKTMANYRATFDADMKRERVKLTQFLEEEKKLRETAEEAKNVLQTEKARLEKELEKANMHSVPLLEYYQQAQLMIDERDKYIAEQVQWVENFRTQLHTLEDERVQLVLALEKERKELRTLQEQRDQWQRELEATEKRYRAEATSLAANLGTARTDLAKTKHELLTAQAEATAWNEDYKKQQQALAQFMAENRKISQERTGLLESQVQLEAENKDCQEKNRDMRGELKDMNAFMFKLDRDIERLVSDADDSQKRMARHAMLTEAQRLVWGLQQKLNELHPDPEAITDAARTKLFLDTMEGLLNLYQRYSERSASTESQLKKQLEEAQLILANDTATKETSDALASKFMEFVVTLDGGWFQNPMTSNWMKQESREDTLKRIFVIYADMTPEEKAIVRAALEKDEPKTTTASKTSVAGESGASSSTKGNSSKFMSDGKPGMWGGADGTDAKVPNPIEVQAPEDYAKILATRQRPEESVRALNRYRESYRGVTEEMRKKLQGRMQALDTKMANLRHDVETVQAAAAAASGGVIDHTRLLEAVEKLLYNAEFMRVSHENSHGLYDELRDDIADLEEIMLMHHVFQSNLRRFILGFRPMSDKATTPWSQELCLLPVETKGPLYEKVIAPLYIDEKKYMDPVQAEEHFRSIENLLTPEVVYESLHRSAVAYALLGANQNVDGSISQLSDFMHNYGNLLQTDLMERLLEVL